MNQHGGNKRDGRPVWADAPWPPLGLPNEARHDMNWFDSSWDLQRGLDVAELNEWPADLDALFPRQRFAQTA
jgi:hypothetical protein